MTTAVVILLFRYRPKTSITPFRPRQFLQGLSDITAKKQMIYFPIRIAFFVSFSLEPYISLLDPLRLLPVECLKAETDELSSHG